ncbi:unnamed protein product [Amoebophrya sp. A120]|nr:unnamed protein product [Amoebophrya sp. A120]|eukprot:GSA120T00005445001.1
MKAFLIGPRVVTVALLLNRAAAVNFNANAGSVASSSLVQALVAKVEELEDRLEFLSENTFRIPETQEYIDETVRSEGALLEKHLQRKYIKEWHPKMSFVQYKRQDCTNKLHAIELPFPCMRKDALDSLVKESGLSSDEIISSHFNSADKSTDCEFGKPSKQAVLSKAEVGTVSLQLNVAAEMCSKNHDCGGFVQFNTDTDETFPKAYSVWNEEFQEYANIKGGGAFAGDIVFVESGPRCTHVMFKNDEPDIQVAPADCEGYEAGCHSACVRASICVEDDSENTYIKKRIIMSEFGSETEKAMQGDEMFEGANKTAKANKTLGELVNKTLELKPTAKKSAMSMNATEGETEVKTNATKEATATADAAVANASEAAGAQNATDEPLAENTTDGAAETNTTEAAEGANATEPNATEGAEELNATTAAEGAEGTNATEAAEGANATEATEGANATEAAAEGANETATAEGANATEAAAEGANVTETAAGAANATEAAVGANASETILGAANSTANATEGALGATSNEREGTGVISTENTAATTTGAKAEASATGSAELKDNKNNNITKTSANQPPVGKSSADGKFREPFDVRPESKSAGLLFYW